MPQREIVRHTGVGADRVRAWGLKNQAENYNPERFAAFEKKTREEFATSMKEPFKKIGAKGD